MAKITVAEIEQTGNKIVIPETMSYQSAIDSLTRRMQYEQEVTCFTEQINGFVWDAALALNKAMAKLFGWATPEPVKGFFGDEPPKMISVETGYEETTLVPWGRFSLPGINGYIETGVAQKGGRLILSISATVRRKHEAQVKALAETARELLKTESVYRGKAFKLRFKDENGNDERMPMPSFIDLRKVKEGELIFSDEVNRAIETSIFTPVRNVEKCREFKIPLKRGILLYGPYGTGKSLTSAVTAKLCTQHGWTFLYCERADELADMVKLAHHYQPAVIFCEDIDRAVSGDRSTAMDDILNIIDGIESKSVELMVILTTNHVETINRALLRPGRLDAVINVLPPDAKAAEKLLRLYGRGLIPANADLSEVSRLLDGKIPAVIRECAERAKLSAIKLGLEGKMILTGEALTDAARTMQDQLDLLAAPQAKENERERLGRTLQETMKTAVSEVFAEHN